MIPLAPALSAAVGVVDRIHRDTTHPRANAEPAPASRLAEGDVLVPRVAPRPDGSRTGEPPPPEPSGGQLGERIVALLRHQLDGRPGAPPELPAPPLAELHVVDHGAERDLRQGKGVAGLDVGL